MYLSDPSIGSIRDAAHDLDLSRESALMVLVAEEDRPDLGRLVEELRDLEVDFFGGLFPALIHETHKHSRGALLVPIPAAQAPEIVTGLDDGVPSLAEFGARLAATNGPKSAIVFVDGLTKSISRLLTELYSQVGSTVRFVGGGAGCLTLRQEPCVFTREGAFQDAAVIAPVAARSAIGVRHGWNQLAGPVIATRASGNVIHELNWRSAFEVYREALAPHTDMELTRENLFAASNAFPFGIIREGNEDVVRDPVSVTEDGALVCVGEVPENVVLRILEGDVHSLVDAARRAAADSCRSEVEVPRSAFIVDCVSRTIYLGDQFATELEAVRASLDEHYPDLPVTGVLSLGEISSHAHGMLEFYNKTIVVSVMHG